LVNERIFDMFRQLVTGNPPSPNIQQNINSLFVYHPLQISALVETFWLNRLNAGTLDTPSPFIPWSPKISYDILNAPFFPGYTWPTTGAPTPLPPPPGYISPLQQPGILHTWDGTTSIPNNMQSTNWDHLIYAYIIENTRIFEIFSKVLEMYMIGEQLEIPSPASQSFWRNLEFMIYGGAVPSMVWTTSSRLRRDEVADRLTSYYWMLGFDLSHAGELAAQHPYQKPAAANRDFAHTFESFAAEVWRGIVNVKNSSGANDTDSTVIATLARRIYDMMATRRINDNIARQEFRAVTIMSYIHLAVLYDSPAVVDLKATASSPEMRLQKIAERVGMKPHTKSKAFFDLAGPFSVLMQMIETGQFNEALGAQALYIDPTALAAQTAETVIDQYSLATGHDLKAQAIAMKPRPAAPTLAGPKPTKPAPHLALPKRTDKAGARAGE
jgi:hypothetical protein